MNSTDAINYQPLFARQHAWTRGLKDLLHGWHGALAAATALVAIVLLFIPHGTPFSIIVIIAYLILLIYHVMTFEQAAWEVFALVNGWTFDEETPLEVIIPPSLQFGYDQTCSPIIQATIGELTCDLLAYSTTTSTGHYRRIHNYTIGALSVPSSLPHMLLLNKKTKIDIARDLENSENLQLEGDFNDYFSLQMEKGQEIDALTIITPDVMQKLVDYNQAEDIEILGTNLYFICSHDRRDYQHMQSFIESIVSLSEQIIHNS